jgi:DNA-directed RNA polymerase subunit K/omega
MDNSNESMRESGDHPEVPGGVSDDLMPAEPPAPISSRFLFVDVAALRAKQLRRGARVRFEAEQVSMPIKPERVAMEEVRRQLVQYTVPPWREAPFDRAH